MFREQLVWKNFYIPNLESIGHADIVFIDYFVEKDHNDKHIFAQMIHLLLGNKRAFFCIISLSQVNVCVAVF